MDAETALVPTVEAEIVPVPWVAGELARNIVAALDVIAESIPDLQTPHPSTARRVRGARTVSRDDVISIVAAVEALPQLQALGTLDTHQAHDVLESMDDYRVIAERLAMLLAKVSYTREARWASLVAAATITYSIASTMATDPENGDIAEHVANIRRKFSRKSGSKRKKPPD